MSYNRITVPLSVDEENLLRRAASRACRRPRDHARYIILSALFGDESPPDAQQKKTSSANASRANAAGVTVNP